MSKSSTITLLLSLSALSACGGGGGGGDSGSTTTPTTPPAAETKLFSLAADNVSQVAEVFRFEVYDPLIIFEELRQLQTQPLPTFNLPNRSESLPCNFGGSVQIAITGGGASITQTFSQCQEEVGVTLNGTLAMSYGNVNQAATTYSFTIDLQNFTATGDGDRVHYNGQSRLDVRIDNIGVVYLDVTNNRTVDAQAVGEVFSSVNLKFSLAYFRTLDNLLSVGRAAGAVDFTNRGRVNFSWLQELNRNQFSGAGSTKGFVALQEDRYSIGLQEDSQPLRSIAARTPQLDGIDAFDSTNDAPVFTPQAKLSFLDGEEVVLNLEHWFSDSDLDVLRISREVVSAPQNAQYSWQDQRLFAQRFTTNTPGAYQVKFTVTDPDGQTATGVVNFDIVADTDGDGIDDASDSDDDNDGVLDGDDFLPLDSSESVDTDGDRTGNNADSDDDNDGTNDSSDSYPLNALCQAVSDGEGGVCASEIIADAQRIVADDDGVLYFLVQNNRKIYRWDGAAKRFLPPLSWGQVAPAGAVAGHLAVSMAHDRLYLGYDSGHLSYFNLAANQPAEQPFHTFSKKVLNLEMAGDYLFAAIESQGAEHVVLDGQNGDIVDEAIYNWYSEDYVWNPALQRIYFMRDGISPNNLHVREIDQASGAFGEIQESPYHGTYGFTHPIVMSADGNRVLVGSGNIFDATSLNWIKGIPSNIAAALWTASDGLLVLRSDGDRSYLERLADNLTTQETLQFQGQAKAIFASPQGYQIVLTTGGDTRIVRYQPSNDSDGDGVANGDDHFPVDIAASTDSDNDGHPDRWNSGYDQTDSTTGLSLDHYPNDAACYLPEHGNGTTCDYDQVIPAFTPDLSVQQGDVVYLLSREHNRVYRWSFAAGGHIAPIIVGASGSGSVLSPRAMTYAPARNRLYFGYDNGAVTYVDLSDSRLAERPFTGVAAQVGGVAAAGEHLVVQDFSGAWSTHYVFDHDGNRKDSREWNHYSSAYLWISEKNRIYYFRDHQSPNDLHYEEIAPGTGEIASQGETIYHGQYDFRSPLLLSPDRSRILVGSGDIFSVSDLTWVNSLNTGFFDHALWRANGEILTLVAEDGATKLNRFNASQAWQAEEILPGVPVGIFEHQNQVYVATRGAGGVVFTPYP